MYLELTSHHRVVFSGDTLFHGTLSFVFNKFTFKAIDQRLADVVSAVSSIIGGISIAFSYGPAMAPIGVLTAVVRNCRIAKMLH